MTEQNNTEDLKQIKTFYEEEKDFFNSLQARWFDECNFEDQTEYKKAIKLKADAHSLKVKSVTLNPKDMSIKVAFNTGHMDLLKDAVKVYSNNKTKV